MVILSIIENYLTEVGNLKNKLIWGMGMKIKRTDFMRYCKDNGIEIYYNSVSDDYVVKCVGAELTRKKTYLECEDYIYEVMVNDIYTSN